MNPAAANMPSSPDIPLHDIKPLVEVPDSSFVFFVILVALGAAVLIVVAYLLWRHLRRAKEANLRELSYEALQNIDFSDAKKAAYAITRHGFCFTGDGERYQEAYNNLVSRLAPYKYKKSVDPIDDETVGYYRIYVEMIDV